MNIILNPIYILKPDAGRVLFLEKESVRLDPDGDEGYNSFIHPVIAIILNSIDGSDIEKCIREAAEILCVKTALVYNFIEKLINNKERFTLEFEGVIYFLPKRCIISSKYPMEKRKKLELADITYETLDLRLKRHLTPTDLTLMVNTICATDCFYCYADRRVKINCKIPFEIIKNIIKQAYNFKARSINVIGGEFFLYKEWRELLIELKKYGFSPFISTKVALKENEVIDLKEIDVEDIQISLDTLIVSNIKDILKVKDHYVDEIKSTLNLLDKHGIKIVIHTIVNSKNDNVEDMASIYNFIKSLKNLKSWRIDKAEASLYHKNDFDVFKAGNDLKPMYDYLKQISDVPVNFDSVVPKIKKRPTHAERLSNFKNRSICSANYSHLFILPDGQVTTCEEFYWHPNFIVGNVLENSILEIWNSERCKYLALVPQEDIPDDSSCHNCKDYYACRSIEQVCFRDIMKVHGKEKWYYPDIRCPKSLANEEKVRV